MKLHSPAPAAFALVLGAMALPAYGEPPIAPNRGAAVNPALRKPESIGYGHLVKGRNSFTRGEAHDLIGRAGYARIGKLSLDRDGLWQARARRHGRWVHVALDYQGNVAAR